MEERLIVGYRPHPHSRSLIQEIFECGHAYSIKREEATVALAQSKACFKCMVGMPPDLSPEEQKTATGMARGKEPLLARLCKSLAFHLATVEAARKSVGGEMPDVDLEIERAHVLLTEAGFEQPSHSPQPSARTEPEETVEEFVILEAPEPPADAIEILDEFSINYGGKS
ncbi:MAG: hypothetical protein JSW10_06585 [Pseudomonadota bacterium]|nr:MAG: hypothetical protein JSW10_06585 [Pseudomonadota bacterium]